MVTVYEVFGFGGEPQVWVRTGHGPDDLTRVR